MATGGNIFVLECLLMMAKRFALFSICLALAPLALASSPFSFSASSFTGFHTGHALEFVYRSDMILSELVWDMKPLLFAGLGAEMRHRNGFSLRGDVSAGLPAITGLMEDSDWMNVPASDIQTNFSRHDAHLLFSAEWNIAAGWDFFPTGTGGNRRQEVIVRPNLGFSYKTWKWEARDGWLQYGNPLPWTEGERIELEGLGISYHQEFWMPTVGIDVSFPITSSLRCSLFLNMSLWVSCNAIDTHFLTDSIYYDVMRGGSLAEPGAQLELMLSESVSISVNYRLTVINSLRGDTAKGSLSSDSVSWVYERDGGGSGAGLFSQSLRLGAVYNFGRPKAGKGGQDRENEAPRTFSGTIGKESQY